jgi:hypothetical protein
MPRKADRTQILSAVLLPVEHHAGLKQSSEAREAPFAQKQRAGHQAKLAGAPERRAQRLHAGQMFINYRHITHAEQPVKLSFAVYNSMLDFFLAAPCPRRSPVLQLRASLAIWVASCQRPDAKFFFRQSCPNRHFLYLFVAARTDIPRDPLLKDSFHAKEGESPCGVESSCSECASS